MKYLPLFMSLLSVVQLTAQDCDKAILAQKPGTWKAGIPGSPAFVAAADLSKEKLVLAGIHKMISANYAPLGCQALYSNSFGGSPPVAGKNWVGDHFYYMIYILRYLCDQQSADKSKYYVDISTPTTVTIYANAIPYFSILYAADLPDDEFRGYLKLLRLPQKKDGYYFLGEEVVGDSHRENKIKEYRWLITYDDNLPFNYVSRKEYLLIQKKRLEKTIQENSGSSFYDKYLKNINEALKRPESELSKPAICMWNDEERFEGFVEEGQRGSFIAVKPNLDYYNRKLQKSVPQFFSVVFKIAHGDPVFESNIDAIKKSIDFAALRNMLGKEGVKSVTETNPVIKAPVVAKKEVEKSNYNIYKNEPSRNFQATPVSQMRNAAQLPTRVDSKIKAKALSIQLNASLLPEYMNQLLVDVEKKLTQQQVKNTQLIFAKFKNNPIDLADAGAMLYYKGAVKEALWCLSKAAAIKPSSYYILSNLTGIMNLAQAEARALPILRFLKSKYPKNTTVLNNLGQAYYQLGELNSSKAALDSCIRIFAYHPQANFTRAIIAEKEGKNQDAARFIEKSMKGAYSEKTDEFARRKGIKLDYSNLLNRYRPTSAEYINPIRYRPPAQCENVFSASADEAKWDEWTRSMQSITGKINAGLAASSANYQRQLQQQKQNPKSTANLSIGPLHSKADKLYKIYMDQAASLQEEAQNYLDHNYKIDKQSIESTLEAAIGNINKKYENTSGEGKGSFSEARCNEINKAYNEYLQNMAGINNKFHNRFSEPLRQLNIELMYWSQLLPGPTGLREMLYYERAIFAVNPMLIKSAFYQPCETNTKGNVKVKEEDLPPPYCPISFKFKVVFAKFNGDCSKFEIELEFEGLVLNLERDFINKKSTIAFGAGFSLDLSNKVDGVSNNVLVPDEIPEFVDMGGGGVGVKIQGFIEIDINGISDVGLRGEAAIEGVGTDKGDLKINGKMGVNSGVDITPSPALENIGKSLNEALIK